MEQTKLEIINIVIDSLTALAVGAGAIAAFMGIDTWKKQLKGSTEYELARRYLKAVYKIRDAMKYVRNPFISVGEFEAAANESELQEEERSDNKKMNRAVYSVRWKKVQESLTELDVELLEAEVFWGKEAVNVSKELDGLVRRLLVGIKMFLEERTMREEHDIIYDMGDDDQFNKDVGSALKKVEDYLQPHLK